MNYAVKLPCSAASALCPFRVARVSRLIGNFDTTVKLPGLQVHFGGTLGSESLYALTGLSNAETPLLKEWRFAVLRWSLAPPALM